MFNMYFPSYKWKKTGLPCKLPHLAIWLYDMKKWLPLPTSTPYQERP